MNNNENTKWSKTIGRHTEGYTFNTWEWYTGKTIIFGMQFYRSFDAAVVEMIAQMVALGYDQNNGIGTGRH